MISISEIAELAESIADSCSPTLPVDPESIASEEGITWSYGGYGDSFDGLLAHRSGRFHIFCNTARGSVRGSRRGRFTFGHELGHYFIDAHRTTLVSQQIRHYSQGEWKSDTLIERQADTFSANLLMPCRRFEAVVASRRAGLATVFAAADAFDVSRTSAAVRYVQTAARPCAIVMWKDNGEFAWPWVSTPAHAAGLHAVIREVPKGADDFATVKALQGKVPPACGFFENVTTASTWFPYVYAGSQKDAPLMEQSARLGDYGVLTMLVEVDPSLW